MERVREVKILDNNGNVEISFEEGKCIDKTYKKSMVIEIAIEGGNYQNRIVDSISLPSCKEISKTKKITFEHCIFAGNCDWNFFF